MPHRRVMRQHVHLDGELFPQLAPQRAFVAFAVKRDAAGKPPWQGMAHVIAALDREQPAVPFQERADHPEAFLGLHIVLHLLIMPFFAAEEVPGVRVSGSGK